MFPSWGQILLSAVGSDCYTFACIRMFFLIDECNLIHVLNFLRKKKKTESRYIHRSICTTQNDGDFWPVPDLISSKKGSFSEILSEFVVRHFPWISCQGLKGMSKTNLWRLKQEPFISDVYHQVSESGYGSSSDLIFTFKHYIQQRKTNRKGHGEHKPQAKNPSLGSFCIDLHVRSVHAWVLSGYSSISNTKMDSGLMVRVQLGFCTAVA